ncbi:unnamed protein product [Toxocara canis]|uniref:Lipoprotein n=1 Tax=Toxocara canis TaxID=6265 RepID=A0A183UUV3_TOXCA|nr:unnamed protein product [Toxocara canis]
MIDSFPSNDPGIPAAVSVSSVIPVNSSVARGLQLGYPQMFSRDLGYYNLVNDTWMQLKANQHHRSVTDIRMDRQFNRQCGARNRTMERVDLVLVRTY